MPGVDGAFGKPWLRAPAGPGRYYFCPDRFAAWLADEGYGSGARTGTPPALRPAKSISDRQWQKWRAAGVADWTYFARGTVTGRIKIGRSKWPERRVRNLKSNCAGFENAELLVSIRDGSWERAYHNAFAAWRDEGEWFAPHPDILAEIDRLKEQG